MPGSICTFLPWDSSFFGLQIARLEQSRLLPETLSEALEWCRQQHIDCLYFLADSNDRETVRLAESARFQFVDVKITLRRMAGTAADVDTAQSGVRPFAEPDLEPLKTIARRSHSDSRFYFDGAFPRERCDALFETWIERSCHGWAEAVFVVEVGGIASGYCTCHVEDGVGSIGLLALAPHAQGQALGEGLIAAGMSYFRKRGIGKVTVATQGRNVRAQQLYQKCGFVTDSVMLWYHKWFRESRATQ